MRALWILVVAAILCVCVQADDEKKPPTKLQIGILKKSEGCVKKAAKGSNVEVHYTGSLWSDGTVFDSSIPRGQPFTFVLGARQVIKGWDAGLMGMCVGEKRKLTIPPDMGYGDSGAPPKIPGGATLVFEVELLDITDDDRDEL